MDEEIERLVVSVRADTAGFARDVAEMRGVLDGPLGEGAERAGRAIDAALARAVRTGKLGFEDLKRVAASAMASIATSAIRGGIGAIGGGSGGLLAGAGQVLGGLLGLPGRATGGPVAPGRGYLVGERGPELFVPTASGRVVPGGAAGVREVRMNIIINAPQGAEPRTLAQSSRQVARAGGAGWRRAQLSASTDGGASWQALGSSGPAATMGVAVDVLEGRGGALFDEVGAVTVQLLHDGMWLEGRDDAALANGANLALIGQELIQFGEAVALGGGRFRLARLLRGRRGTEWAAGLHDAGERFVLIEAEAMTVADAPLGAIGGEMRVEARGIGDQEPATAAAPIEAEALRPPPPVHPQARMSESGALELSWVRRSRTGWSWPSGSDTPLGEESELYRVTISGAEGGGRTLECTAPSCAYTAADQAADGCFAPFTVAVTQVGTFASSRAARLIVQ